MTLGQHYNRLGSEGHTLPKVPVAYVPIGTGVARFASCCAGGEHNPKPYTPRGKRRHASKHGN